MARKKAKNNVSTIVTINNYLDKSYVLKHDVLSPVQKLTYKSNYFFTTYLANKDMIIAPVEVVAGIDDADLDGMLDDRAYDELGLDPAKEYVIRRYEIDSKDPNKRVFQLFVIEQETYTEIFESLRNRIKYIDLIVPAPLLYRSLYTMDVLEPKGVHTFLYFTHHDTFVTFYKNGKYLYSKSIPYSLEQIYNRYCEMVGESVDENKFFRTLQKDGLKTLQSDFQQNLMKLFGEIFISINDIIIYTKRAYDLEVIDQMYIGSEMGTIAGLDEYVQNYLGFHSVPLEFDFGIRTEEWHTDQLQYMMAVSAHRYMETAEDTVNFTLYPKPPTFFKRPSGQIVALTAAALMLALALPAWNFFGAKMNDIQTYRLKKEDAVLAREVAKYKRILRQKKKEYEAAADEVKKLSERFVAKEKTLRTIYDKKVHYRLKSDQMISLSNDLAKFGVQTNRLESDIDHYRLNLIAPSDKKITQLIKAVSDKYADQIERIDIQTIEKDQNSTYYQGVLKVDLR
jgi:flagellar biosynthesis chaperone FliJ